MQSPPPAERPLAGRLVGAPISWGVCEVPGWGATLDRDRFLSFADLYRLA